MPPRHPAVFQPGTAFKNPPLVKLYFETLYVPCHLQLIISNVLGVPYNRITVRTKRLGKTKHLLLFTAHRSSCIVRYI